MGKISEAKKRANKKWNDKNRVKLLHLNILKKLVISIITSFFITFARQTHGKKDGVNSSLL
ncbi:hypothetical protein SAMN04487792_0274 [Lactobacillus bombicola]|uniref:Uncharacterized protein n=1 Tax=Lactobacillus bombicola TaxID=1505723 RepID=A0A1I1RGE3_9LACO|nr:hypothetical protein SAMN04487792_0274 [Lactobacillus bombicola]